MGTHHNKRNRSISTQPIDLVAIFLLQSAIIEVHLHKQTSSFRQSVSCPLWFSFTGQLPRNCSAQALTTAFGEILSNLSPENE